MPRLSRRAFLGFAAAMTTLLALPSTYVQRVAAAVEASPRVPVLWLHGQSCGGDTEAFLRAADPTTVELLLDILSVRFDDALMASSGAAAWDELTRNVEALRGTYFLVVEGSVPTGAGGAYAAIAGRAFDEVVRTVAAGAKGVVALGSCATSGGIAAAGGGMTDAQGLAAIVPTDRFVALPGCPVNPANLTATIVHSVTFGALPPTDALHRPLFAYGGLLHNQCDRRAHFEFGEFAQSWGDEGAQKGWCLYKLGCKGPETYANCPTIRYGEGTSWPVRAGHGCVGCTMPGSWDAMSPFYRRLPAPLGFLPHLTADHVGAALVAGVAAVTVAHGTATYVRSRRNGNGRGPEAGPRDARGAGESAGAAPEPEAVEPEAVEPEAVEPKAVEPEAVEPEVPQPAAPEPQAAVPEPQPATPKAQVAPDTGLGDTTASAGAPGDPEDGIVPGTNPPQGQVGGSASGTAADEDAP